MTMKTSKLKLLSAAALAGLLALPQTAEAAFEDDYVVINGNVVNWYYFGKDLHSNDRGWFEVSSATDGVSNYGLMSFALNTAAQDPKYTVHLQDFPVRNNLFYGNGGGIYTGDAYYTFFMGETGWEDNLEGEYGSETYTVTVRKWTWDESHDADGYKVYSNIRQEEVGKMGIQALDMAYDPLYDKVYGIFYNGTSYKLGTIDLETLRVTYISKEGWLYGAPNCLAINSKGELYGIDAGGSVYKIDKETGALTTIGSTGVVGQRRMQSATFDLRTDKLYWCGFLNNGKSSADPSGTNTALAVADGGRDTGIFEVNTETGAATLIGSTDQKATFDEATLQVSQFGKFQLTGIYVDGSFTKKNVDQSIELLSAPTQLKAGEKGTITLRVKNIGLEKVLAKNYLVKVYANGQLVATIDRDSEPDPLDNLDKGESQTLTLQITAPSTSGQLTIYAEVVNDADEELRNNKTAEAIVGVLSGKTLPNPELDGSNRLNNVKLTWADPQGHVLEGAEQFAAFTYDGLNEWTMVDGDKAYTQSPQSWNDAIRYPNANTPKAYIVFNPQEAGIYDVKAEYPQFDPHNGSQYFAAWWSAVPDDTEAGGHQVQNCDYMVSPTLSGDAQTITFWAKGYKGSTATGYETEANYTELMRVLCTTAESTDPTAYEVVADTFAINSEAWTRYSAKLPAGTKHFALQCVSKEGFVLMVDDIEFRVAPKTVTGYRIYKNGEKVAEVAADKFSWNGMAADTDVFTVTAVYADGESAFSNPYSITGKKAVQGDINLDDKVNGSDIQAIINLIVAEEYQKEADINGDGKVNGSDIQAIINIIIQE